MVASADVCATFNLEIYVDTSYNKVLAITKTEDYHSVGRPSLEIAAETRPHLVRCGSGLEARDSLAASGFSRGALTGRAQCRSKGFSPPWSFNFRRLPYAARSSGSRGFAGVSEMFLRSLGAVAGSSLTRREKRFAHPSRSSSSVNGRRGVI